MTKKDPLGHWGEWFKGDMLNQNALVGAAATGMRTKRRRRRK